MTAPLRVVIADDERPARSFLAALLRTFSDVRIVGEAESGRDAVSVIVREKPDRRCSIFTCRNSTVSV
jgi:YesN/AraC family two-component response regulator